MKTIKFAALATASVLALAMSPQSFATDTPATAPAADQGKATDSDTMKRADHDMRKVLKSLQSLNGKPIETLSAAEARRQPTPTDAVTALLKKKGKDPEKLKADSGVTTKDLTYPAASGSQPARAYFPKDKGDKPLPVIVYYHGGGFVIADINVYDEGPRSLAKKTGAIVVSAEYAHAPEHKFPAQQNDAFAAYQWTLKNAASWGGDPARVAVAGESAGGNLATNVAIEARDKKVQAPVALVAVYPMAGTDFNTPSYQQNAYTKPLNKAMMEWFYKNTVSSNKDMSDPRLDLVHADLKGLPPATIITDSIDPLMSDGKMLADNMAAAGDKVDYKNFDGVTHEFFGMDAVVSKAGDAQDLAAKDLKKAFSNAEDQQKKAQ